MWEGAEHCRNVQLTSLQILNLKLASLLPSTDCLNRVSCALVKSTHKIVGEVLGGCMRAWWVSYVHVFIRGW